MAGNTEETLVGASARTRRDDNDNAEWFFDGEISNVTFLDRPLDPLEAAILATSGGELSSLPNIQGNAPPPDQTPDPGTEGVVAMSVETDGFAHGSLAGAMVLYGSNQSESIDGSTSADHVYANAGNDTILGHEGQDVLNGGAGNDWLDVGAGAGTNGGVGGQSARGGIGDDTYVVSSASGYVSLIEDASADGEDRVVFQDMTFSDFKSILMVDATQERVAFNYGTDGSVHVWNLSNFEHFEFADGTSMTGAEIMDILGVGQATPDPVVGLSVETDGFDHGSLAGVRVLYGSGETESIEGSTSADYVYANGGDDSIFGHEGQDVLDGGAGNDWLDLGAGAGTTGGLGGQLARGGLGDDTYVVSSASGYASLVEDASAGGEDTIIFQDLNLSDFTSIRMVDAGIERVALNYGTDGAIHVWNASAFEEFEFADGTTMTGTEVMDLISA
jgi:Ca2+-binding RTX toxin-like protein